MSLRFTILGCGSSMGVPRVALGWGSCDPNNLKNRRRRCALLVERLNTQGRRTRVLVDCTPDLREQLLDAEVDWLDGVLITHEHADHTHGIDDLRPLFVHRRCKVDVWLDEPTSRSMHARFGYCFMTPPGSEYPPILTERRLLPGQAVSIGGQGGPIEALPVLQNHGDIPSLGFRFGNVAYSADIKSLPEAGLAALAGLDAGRQAAPQRRVIHVAVQIGQDRPFGLHARDPAQRLVEVEMARVRRLAQRVHDPNVEAGQGGQAGLRQALDIGGIGHVAEAEAERRDIAVVLQDG
jgi:phosphoribosyl 1,2-cyclic phosphate phosphodiesterase